MRMTIHRKVTLMAAALVGAVGAVAGFGAYAISQSTEFVEVDLRRALEGADGAMESRISMLKELWGATQVTGQANEASVKAGQERLRVEGVQFEAAFGELEESGVVPDATTAEVRQLHARFRRAADHLMEVRHRVDVNMEALDARTERIVERGIETGASARFVDQLWRLTMAANDYAFTGLADALETYEALRPKVGHDLERQRGLSQEAGPYLEALDGLMAERKVWNQAYGELEDVATRLDGVLAVAEAGDEAKGILGASGFLAGHVSDFTREVAVSRATQTVLTVFAVVVGLGFLLLGASIARRIGRLRDALVEDPEDLTKRLVVDGDDELGDLAQSVNEFISTVQTVVRGIADASGTLATSARGLSATSHQLTAEAQSVDSLTARASEDVDQILDRIQIIASAIEQSSVSINQTAAATQQIAAGVTGVASGAEEMSTNIRTVATAVEELSASLAEVARSGSDSAEAGRESAAKTRDAAERIGVLAEAAARIGNVIALIEDIADQTNLLALNATIEAASAGEAGRGFSVVASEIKALARQTTRATEEIVQEVGAIRTATKGAVDRIQEVTTDADRVDELARVIARAVEEQSTVTTGVSGNVAGGAQAASDVSLNVSEISRGVDDVARQTSELAAGATEISNSSSRVVVAARSVSSSIGEVRAAATETSAAAEEVARAALAGDQLATELQGLVSRFRL